MKIFGYTIAELQAAIIAGLYGVFAIVMLFIIPPAGFEQAVIAVVPAVGGVILVFTATEHSTTDLQKALEALKVAFTSAISFYVVVPASVGDAFTMLITGVVMAAGVAWARKDRVSKTKPLEAP